VEISTIRFPVADHSVILRERAGDTYDSP